MIRHLALWLFILALPARSFAESDCAQARSTIAQYYAALTTGDQAGLQNTTRGPLLKQHNSQFRNPNYADHLRTFYANFAYDILSCKGSASSSLLISVTEFYGQQDRINKFFTVDISQGYRIVHISLIESPL